MQNLTQKQYEKIENAKLECDKFRQLLLQHRNIKEDKIISYVTQKTFSNGIQKMAIMTMPQVKVNNSEKERDVNNRTLHSVISSCNRAKQLAFDLAFSNKWEYFITLTFDNDKLDGKRLDDDYVKDKLKNWLHSLKRKFPDIKYIIFPEYHEKGGLHFHGMLAGATKEELKLNDSGFVSCSWSKKGYCLKSIFEKTKEQHTLKGVDGSTVYNMQCFNLGFTTVTLTGSSEACVKYAMKYVTKTGYDERFFNKKRYWVSRNIERPYINKVQLEVGTVYSNGGYDKYFILEKNYLDELQIDLSSWQINYADDDKQYLILERRIDIINESGRVTTIRKRQV